MKIFLLMIGVILSSSSFACGGFGNGGDGCADAVAGVQTEGGTKIEITTSGTAWYPEHVCTGSNRIQFAGTDLEKQAALSIAMASYMVEKGPIFFRCTEKLSNDVCGCTNIVLGNSWRD